MCIILTEISSGPCAMVFIVQRCFLFLWDLFHPIPCPRGIIFTHHLFWPSYHVLFPYSQPLQCYTVFSSSAFSTTDLTQQWLQCCHYCSSVVLVFLWSPLLHTLSYIPGPFTDKTLQLLLPLLFQVVSCWNLLARTPASFWFCQWENTHLPVHMHLICVGYMSSHYFSLGFLGKNCC